MQFGVCGGPDLARIAKEEGYDYFEWSVGGLLHPRESEDVFQAALAEARAVGLPCPAVNVFIPADLKITGPEVNRQALEAFAETALRRAEIAGVEVIVFGSGGARRIPDGFDAAQGWQQMVSFARWLGPAAEKHHVTIAIEHLNKTETNLINTAEEAAELIREVNHPNIRLLVDGYHWAKDQNAASGIVNNASLIVHAHIATAEGRRTPRPEDPCTPFFDVLRKAGYNGRLSFEGSLQNPREELAQAIQIMREQAAV